MHKCKFEKLGLLKNGASLVTPMVLKFGLKNECLPSCFCFSSSDDESSTYLTRRVILFSSYLKNESTLYCSVVRKMIRC